MKRPPISKEALVAEFLAMTIFVFVGPGSATGVAGTAGWVQQVSLTFGLCISTLAYSVGHFSGGHINCAVTLGLVIAGKCPPLQGVANFGAQILGTFCGAGLLALVKDHEQDRTGNLGSNTLAPGVSAGSALLAEVIMTSVLVLVVIECACSPRSAANRTNAALAIGFAVYLAHSVLIPIDGCSINPTRSLGPAMWASMLNRDKGGVHVDTTKIWQDHWIFWVGPLLGAAAVGITHRVTGSVYSRLRMGVQAAADERDTPTAPKEQRGLAAA